MKFWENISLAFKGGGGHTKPPLGRSYIGTYGGASFTGKAPYSYEGQVRDAYINNAIAQRAVRIVAEGVGGAPLVPMDDGIATLVNATSAGQSLLETLAAHLLLHGNAYVQVMCGADDQPVELFALRPDRITIEPVERAERQILPETKLPRQYALRYYEPARDYQSGMQNAFRPGQSRVVLDRDFPAAIPAVQAKAIAQTKLWSLYQERVTARVHIPRTDRPVAPGTFVRMDDSEDIWLVRNWELNHASISLDLSKATSRLAVAEKPTDNGRPVKELDALAGMTRLALVDLPFALDAPSRVSESARLYAAAAGDAGWRNAQLFAVTAEGASTDVIGQIPAPAVIGTTLESLGSSGPHIIDRKTTLLVQMHNRNMVLKDANRGQLLGGHNMAAIGAELVQFGFAEPLGDGRYLLSFILRGLGGTEREMDRHSAGEDFVLLDGSGLTEIDTRHYIAFRPFQISALGRGDESPVLRSIDAPGRALKPWSPVHPRYFFTAQGDLEIGWTRRSRAGLIWPDNIETPLAEEVERYRVTICPNAPLEQEQSSISISADQIEDFRQSGVAKLSLEVRQVGRHNISDPLSFAVKI